MKNKQDKFKCKHIKCDSDGCYCAIGGGSYNHCVLPYEKDKCEYFEEKLLPCPFCGGEANLIKRKLKTGFYPSGGTYYVHCKKCLITTQPRNKVEPIIKAWNRRVEK